VRKRAYGYHSPEAPIGMAVLTRRGLYETRDILRFDG